MPGTPPYFVTVPDGVWAKDSHAGTPYARRAALARCGPKRSRNLGAGVDRARAATSGSRNSAEMLENAFWATPVSGL